MKKVTIKKGWFFSAGYIYHWHKVDRNIHPHAVGIDMAIIKSNDVIQVVVKDKQYTLNCADALAFIRKWQSYKWIKEKCIGIVSQSLLQEIT
jgi:hypothetical protein